MLSIEERTRLEIEVGQRTLLKYRRHCYVDELHLTRKISVNYNDSIVRIYIRPATIGGADAEAMIEEDAKEFPSERLFTQLKLLFG